eukprot:jgi/Antlo1/1376/1219
MVAELFRRAILIDQNVHTASEHPVQLLFQNSHLQLLLILVIVFTLFVLFLALRRFGRQTSPFLIYVVCMITVYVAFCTKKARSARNGVYDDESFYGGGRRLSFSEKLIAAANSDYLGKKVLCLLSSRLRSKDTEKKNSAGLGLENGDSSYNEDGSLSDGLKNASEDYYRLTPHESDSETTIVKRNVSQTEHRAASSLHHLTLAKRARNSGDRQNASSAGRQYAKIVQQVKDVKGDKKYDVDLDEKGYRSNMYVHRLKGTTSTDNKDNETGEKNKYASRNSFFREIQEQIQNKKLVDSQLGKIKKSIQIARSHVVGLIEKFRKDYRVFCALSQGISDKLLSKLGISTDLYAYELDELEEEVIKKYTLYEDRDHRNRGEERSNVKNKNAAGSRPDNSSITQTTNSQVLGVLKGIKDAKERIIEDKDRHQSFGLIKRKLEAIEFYLTLEGAVSLILILMVLAEMYEYVAMLRFVLIIALLINIYTGIFILADGKTLETHCQRRMLEGCKQGTHEVNDIVQLLNRNARLENQVDVINDAFYKISSDAKQQIMVIKKYLVNSLNSRADVKILVFETFIDKLKSVEESFNDVSEGNTDKVAFYNTVDAMQRDLENIKSFAKSMNIAKILDVYQRLFQVEFFFNGESQRVSERIKSIVDADTNDLGRSEIQKCIDFIEGTCNAQKEHDILSFILVLFPIFFIALLLF